MIHPYLRPNTWILSGDPAVSALLTSSGLYLEYSTHFFLCLVDHVAGGKDLKMSDS